MVLSVALRELLYGIEWFYPLFVVVDDLSTVMLNIRFRSLECE